ncbi:MAG: glycosyltransferase [Bacteroidales bacterium]|nr:glycosyltransferase [Bacteroidales bacterium]
MKISIVINGTRGDVQPMLVLAIGLKKNGHEVILFAPPENEEIANKYNCPFVAFGPNYKEKFKQNAQMKGGATSAPSPKEMKTETDNQIKKLPKMVQGSDLVLGVGFVLGVHTVADLLKIPYRFVIFYPMLLGTSKKDPFFNRLLFGLGRSMTNLVMKSFINKSRNDMGLPPIKDVWEHWMGEHVIAACDKELNTVRDGVSFNFTQTGYMLFIAQDGLPEYVDNFLKSGKPPIYIGFGSNPVDRPEKYNLIFNQVSKETNQRLIVSKGWANLQENNSTDILYVDEIPLNYYFHDLSNSISWRNRNYGSSCKSCYPTSSFPIYG